MIFSFKLLPSDIRVMIYPYTDLQMQHDLNAPAVVLALAADPVLYNEILPVYKACNTTITFQDQEGFKKMKMKELLKIRYLRISYKIPDGIDPATVTENQRLELRANKCFLRNAFETLTFDISAEHKYYTGNPHWEVPMTYMIRASVVGVKKIILKRKASKEVYRGDNVSRILGAGPAICEKVVGKDGRELDVWTWQKQSGEALNVNREARTRESGDVDQRLPATGMLAQPMRSLSVRRRAAERRL